MFSGKTIRGAIRLCAALILNIILLPYILRIYLVLAPGADARSVWISFVQAVPFGDWLATVAISLWAEAQSGIDTITGWLTSPNVPFPIHLTVETSKLIFSGILLIVVTNFVGKKLLRGSGGGILNHAADVVFEILCCFGATLIADIVFRFFDSQLVEASVALQNTAAVLFSITASGGSLIILLVLKIAFGRALLAILTNCCKLIITYGTFLWLLLGQLQGGPEWLLPLGVMLCLLVLWIIQRIEKLLLPS